VHGLRSGRLHGARRDRAKAARPASSTPVERDDERSEPRRRAWLTSAPRSEQQPHLLDVRRGHHQDRCASAVAALGEEPPSSAARRSLTVPNRAVIIHGASPVAATRTRL
jgi:hypothetical protein